MFEQDNLSERPSKLSSAKQALLESWIRGNVKAPSDSQGILRCSQHDLLALSFAQQRLWFLNQLEPGNPAYNVSVAFRLSGQLNVAALEQSLNEIVRRHEALRTNFTSKDGQPIQVIGQKVAVALPVVDLRGVSESERETQTQQLITAEDGAPFNLTQGPLFRTKLLYVDKVEYIFLLTVHHIVFDVWSFGVFMRELAVLYDAFSTGKPSSLPDLRIQYADFAIWQRQWLQGEALDSQLAYWKQQLGGQLPDLDLPTDRPRPPVQTYRGARQSLVLSKSLIEKLKILSNQEGITLFMLLLAAFKVLLYRYTGQTDIIVGSPIANRNRSEIEGLIGFFANTLVLRTSLSDNPSFRQLLNRVRDVCRGAYDHQELPFEKLLEELQPVRSLSRNPLFQVCFNMFRSDSNAMQLAGLTCEAVPQDSEESIFDITLSVDEQTSSAATHSPRITLDLVYKADLFDEARMAELLAQYERLLMQIVTDPDTQIDAFSLVTPVAEGYLPDPTARLSDTWQGAVHTSITRQARLGPNRLAVTDSKDSWSYGELNRRSNQLARYLLTNGVQRGSVVAIYAHRSASLVWAVLGVLKAGAAFLILDSAYPEARLVRYLELAQPRGWLQIDAAGAPPKGVEECLDKLAIRCRLTLPSRSVAVAQCFLAEFPEQDPNVAIGPDDLAYISFTSGSTGEPKGVMGRHGPLSYFLPWQTAAFQLSAADHFSMLSGLAHTPLQSDIFTALWVGGQICVPDPAQIGNPGWLVQWLRQTEVTVAHLTPAMGQLIVNTPNDRIIAADSVPSLRYALFVGDRLARRDVSRLCLLAPNLQVINRYGSTETQRAVSYTIVENPILAPGRGASDPHGVTQQPKETVPLGRGMPDVQLLVLNRQQQLAGVGEMGEIYIRSPHVSAGYLGDPTLTKARFLVNPFTREPDDRIYRTGDLGRYLPDGEVEFIGRVDHQVKIRGFRVELGEIEGVLGQHPAVRQTVVVVREEQTGDKRLVAYLAAHPGSVPTTSELRHFLKGKLPDYMVPSAFVILDKLPLTPNGKVDRAALPIPDRKREEHEHAFVAPRDELEFRLAKLWEQLLGIQPIGVRDDFFDAGGHSLLAVQLFAQIHQAFGKSLPLTALFQAPTVEDLANILRQDGWVAPKTSLVALQPAGSSRPFFCVPPQGNSVVGLSPLARHLDENQPFYGLQPLGFDSEEAPHTQVEAMAAHYVTEIRRIQPEGPYLLGGQCFGGTVAFEMAQQLQAQGEKVALLVMFDSLPPPRATAAPNSLVSKKMRFLAYRWRNQPLTYIFEDLRRGELWRFPWRIRRQVQRKVNTWFGNPQARGIQHVFAAHGKAREDYAAQIYSGRITLFWSSELYRGAFQGRTRLVQWAALAGGRVEHYEFPIRHDVLLAEPGVQVVADQLQICLSAARNEDLDITSNGIG